MMNAMHVTWLLLLFQGRRNTLEYMPMAERRGFTSTGDKMKIKRKVEKVALVNRARHD